MIILFLKFSTSSRAWGVHPLRAGLRFCSTEADNEAPPQFVANTALDLSKISANRPKAKLDSRVANLVERGKFLGRGVIPCTEPPKEMTQTLLKIISKDENAILLTNIPKYIGTGQKIERYLWSRKLPMDSRSRVVTKNKFRHQILKQYSSKIQALSDEKDVEGLLDLEKVIEKEVETKLGTTGGNWKPIHFDHAATWSYILGGSSAFDYASAVYTLKKVFEDNKGFLPSSHLDFGSGVGTFSWALKYHFHRSLKEEFLVDLSPDMNDASRLFRSDGLDSTPEKIIHDKGVFYRLHFPANENLKYDLVTSGSSLSELESSQLRLSTVDSLWRRVEEGGYLVIYERGTNAGFQVLSEVRDYLIQVQNYGEEDPSILGELIAPCTHSITCPRYVGDTIPCNFDVKYKNFQIPHFPNDYKEQVYKSRISYLIFRKGRRSLGTHPRWQRIVKEKKRTKNTFICELCTSKGSLQEIFVHKRDKVLYKYTKQVEIGDLYKAELLSPQKE